MKEDMIKKDKDEILEAQDDNMIDRKTDWTGEHPEIEEVSLEDDSPGFEWGWMNDRSLIMKAVLPAVCLMIGVLILIIAGVSSGNSKKRPVKETYVSSVPREDTETAADKALSPETEDMETEENNTESKGSGANDRLMEELDKIQDQLTETKNSFQSLHDTVFGETGQGTSLGCVTTVTGFTDREKREIGFLESDFLKDAGAFLAGQQIQTKRIIIEDRIAGSSSAAVAFQGRLEGKDDYILDVVFYPDLPGEYIFLLRNAKGNERGNNGPTAQGTDGQSTSQASQNNNSAQTTRAEAAVGQNTESTPTPQNSYDATNLAIKKIPETLLNYIDNRYEFQYSLYDWLYNHGKKDVESATVTDYSIDGDSRTASISLSLSDGSSISAVYDKTGNSYSFKR